MDLKAIIFHMVLFLLSQSLFNASADKDVYIDVSRPINFTAKVCSVLALQHDFDNTTDGNPPVEVPYNPPANCSGNWNKVILQWKATCDVCSLGIAGVWLSGVEILRTSTVVNNVSSSWEVNKDVTRYFPLLKKCQNLVVMFDNLLNLHVNITFHFLESHDDHIAKYYAPANLILPISKPSATNGGHWFSVQNTSDIPSQKLQVPSNVYRAVVEIYVSAHNDDEYWWTNLPNDFLNAHNHSLPKYSSLFGNGAFREVFAFVDAYVAGVVWPFPVLYGGSTQHDKGAEHLLWDPLIGIGAFNLPTYDLEVTPFLGLLVDGKYHTFALCVVNALPRWLVNANLHLWLDETTSIQTVGELANYQLPGFSPSVVSQLKNANWTFDTSGERTISYSGWVNSTQGNFTTHVFQSFNYSNLLTFSATDSESFQMNEIDLSTMQKVTVDSPSEESVFSQLISNSYPLFYYRNVTYLEAPMYLLLKIILHAFSNSIANTFLGRNTFGSVDNAQESTLSVRMSDDVAIGFANGLTGMQTYKYGGSDECYYRGLDWLYNEIIQDVSNNTC